LAHAVDIAAMSSSSWSCRAKRSPATGRDEQFRDERPDSFGVAKIYQEIA
jgi:hypothetical protein